MSTATNITQDKAHFYGSLTHIQSHSYNIQGHCGLCYCAERCALREKQNSVTVHIYISQP